LGRRGNLKNQQITYSVKKRNKKKSRKSKTNCLKPASHRLFEHMTQFDYRKALRDLLALKQIENPHYSGRAFARDLGLSVTAMHGVLNQTRHLAKNNLELIADKLNWNNQQLELAFAATKQSYDPTQNLLDEDQFQMIADWVHLAILNLAKIKNLKQETIATRLGIEQEVCADCVQRLIRLNYLEIDEHGHLKRVFQSFGVTRQTPSQAIQSFHHSNLAKAQTALKEVPVPERNFLTIAAPTHTQKLPEIQKLIEEFRKQALNLFECENADQVYFLNLQLYPVSRATSKSIIEPGAE
jgi:hypothetical protein